MIKNKIKCNLTFNLSKLSYSEVCSIAQLRTAILALSILWGEKKGPCQGGEMEGSYTYLHYF